MKKEVFFDVPRTYYTTSYTRTQKMLKILYTTEAINKTYCT
jgi:hypothetical protein